MNPTAASNTIQIAVETHHVLDRWILRGYKDSRGDREKHFRQSLRCNCVGLLLFVFGAGILFACSELAFFKSTVINISDRRFFIDERPEGFLFQNQIQPRLLVFRSQLPTDLTTAKPSLATAIRIRHWVRTQQPDGDSWKPRPITLIDRMRGDIEDPLLILRAQRSGAPAVCRRFAYLLAGALQAVGMPARIIIVSESWWKSSHYGHVMTETWIPELHKWVLLDAMWDSMYTLDGTPASAMEINDSAVTGKVENVELFNGAGVGIHKKSIITHQFRHVFMALTDRYFGGYRVCYMCEKQIRFAHYVSRQSSAYPEFEKRVGQIAGGSAMLLSFVIICRGLYFHRSCRPAYSQSAVNLSESRDFAIGN